MSTALGQDTKASAVQLGKALQDPVQGINALRRVGVNFTDAQKDVIEKLVNSGKQLEAQKLILKELSTEFGGSAQAAAGTFGGKITQLMNKVNDLEETMGGLIAQRLEPLVGIALEIVDAFSDVISGTSSLADFTQLLSDKLGILGTVAGGVITFFAEHEQALIALAGAISGFLTIAIIGATIAMMSFIGVSLPVIAIAAAIGAVAALIIANWSGISSFFQAIGTTIASIFTFIYTSIVTIMTTVWNAVSPILTAIWTVFSTVFNAIFQVVSWVFQQVWTLIQFYVLTYAAIFQTFLIGLQMLWNLIWGALAPYVQQVWSNITTFVSGGMNWVNSVITSGLTAIRSIWENSWKSKYETVVTWVEKIKNYVQEGVEKVKQLFRDLADAISNILKNIHIPSLHIDVEEADVAGHKIKVPKLKWYEQGGFVPNTGLAYLHAGEFVLSKDMLSGQSSVPQNVSTVFDQPISIQAVINTPMDVSKLGYELAWMLRNSR